MIKVYCLSHLLVNGWIMVYLKCMNIFKCSLKKSPRWFMCQSINILIGYSNSIKGECVRLQTSHTSKNVSKYQATTSDFTWIFYENPLNMIKYKRSIQFSLFFLLYHVHALIPVELYKFLNNAITLIRIYTILCT